MERFPIGLRTSVRIHVNISVGIPPPFFPGPGKIFIFHISPGINKNKSAAIRFNSISIHFAVPIPRQLAPSSHWFIIHWLIKSIKLNLVGIDWDLIQFEFNFRCSNFVAIGAIFWLVYYSRLPVKLIQLNLVGLQRWFFGFNSIWTHFAVPILLPLAPFSDWFIILDYL